MTALRAKDPATTRICDGGNGDEGEDERGSLFRHAQEEGGGRGEGVEDDGVEVRSARRTSSVNTTAPRRAQIVARGIMEECTASACYTSIQLQADADEPLPLPIARRLRVAAFYRRERRIQVEARGGGESGGVA
ncbi:hypothetical protein R3P38DRAFT_3215526 [Favolaschia claudopus]|uniref:Uncharacterized protein n=1 Tax=Favolaschia claudopus TaxID=2862362 RepID=A0AAW0A857_9AGAR